MRPVTYKKGKRSEAWRHRVHKGTVWKFGNLCVFLWETWAIIWGDPSTLLYRNQLQHTLWQPEKYQVCMHTNLDWKRSLAIINRKHGKCPTFLDWFLFFRFCEFFLNFILERNHSMTYHFEIFHFDLCVRSSRSDVPALSCVWEVPRSDVPALTCVWEVRDLMYQPWPVCERSDVT